MKIKKYLGIILIVVGIGIIGSAIGMRLISYYRQKAMMNAFENTLQQMDKNGNQKQDNASNPSITPPSLDGGAIGIMTIPKINLKVAIGEGVDNETLKFAVGHFKGTAMPGEKGNFCAAGHRSYTYNEYFNRLDEVNKGDEIIVKTQKGEFKYQVTDQFVVEPSQVEVLKPTDDATLTLVTCTPVRVATHRLIIKAKLEK